MKNFRDKRALITGGAQGIGLALARELAERGSELVLTDIKQDALDGARKQLEQQGARCATYVLDVTDQRAIIAARDKIERERGPIDVLVNNAGVVFGGPFLEVPLEKHIATYRVNVEGVVAMTHAFLKRLIERPEAHLINIASASGLVALPHGSTYASSKWAVIGFSESIRAELKGQGHAQVGVTTVCPSFVATGMFDGVKPPRLTRFLTPEDLARKVVAAVERNRPMVLEPWLIKVTPLLMAVLPRSASDKVADVMGASSSMHGWRGHA